LAFFFALALRRRDFFAISRLLLRCRLLSVGTHPRTPAQQCSSMLVDAPEGRPVSRSGAG
jgi:hypothetical protein